ncbi:hypothetical protein AAUPMC_10443, partial [Pasteurella multocida subsp. multocida str. Anand1_cattle]
MGKRIKRALTLGSFSLFGLFVQIRFCLLFPNVASALLLLVTANVALSLAISLLGDIVHMMIFLNMLFLVCYEYFGERLRDQNWRILPKIALLILVFAFGWALI